ncbi:MAG: PilN domain-containing protein [Gemmatimonadota bacterium]|nr:MAG: PilN domain-containing protein [Gemmatimonadota bacterium]
MPSELMLGIMKPVDWVRHRSRAAVRTLRARRGKRLGLAIGTDRVIAVELRRTLSGLRPGRVLTRQLQPPTEDGSWPDLSAALAELRDDLGAVGGRASIALLRPLAHAKVIPVPPVRRGDLRPLLTRNVRRYFLVGAGAVAADAESLGRRRRGETVRAMAVCGSASRVESIYAAVSEAGFRPDVITAAPLAIIGAVAALVPGARKGPLTIAIYGPGWREGIAVQEGVPHLLEPWNGIAATDVAGLVAGLGRAGPGEADGPGGRRRTVVLAAADDWRKISNDLSRETGEEPLEAAALSEFEPAALAAYGAALVPDSAPLLLSERARRVRQGRLNRRVAGLAAAAVVAIATAGGLRLWGLGREFDAVAAERRAHALEVSQALQMRQTAEAIRVRLESIASVEQSTLLWTPAVAALAEALPDSAYLVSLSAEGMQLRLTGVASSASAIVPALEASPLLREVSLTSARRADGSGEGESFDLALAIEADSALAAVPPESGEGG